MTTTTLDDVHVGSLSQQISGCVLRPHDVGYDEARAVHNGLIDRRPALIVRCRWAGDIVAALAFAHRNGLEISIRGGGHNVAGRAVTDGGLMIDLSLMKRVDVDAAARTATVEAGVIWGELNDAGQGALWRWSVSLSERRLMIPMPGAARPNRSEMISRL